MKAVASMVTTGGILADIGTDHAYVPIALVQRQKIKGAIAMDINEGPLARAQEHIRAARLEEYIQTRLSDGAEALLPNEADSILIAGMGGELILHILTEGESVCSTAKELILQPQSEIHKVREYLRQHQYKIEDEDMVCEEGKYYPRLLDVNNDGKINDEDKIWLGTKTPKHRMTLSSDLNLFKCINFSFVLRGEFGWMDIDNLPRNETNRFYNTSNSVWTEYWTPWNPNSKYARLGANVDSPGVNIYEKRNYVRMQNMALSYTFPKKLINKFMIDNLRFSINVDNAFVISKWRTSDPLTKAVTPRIWTFGVDITL